MKGLVVAILENTICHRVFRFQGEAGEEVRLIWVQSIERSGSGESMSRVCLGSLASGGHREP